MKVPFSLFGLLVFSSVVFSGSPGDYDEGAVYFKQDCAACHTIGEGDAVGPDLSGVHLRRSNSWLFDFIKNPQAVINKGDKDAVEVYKKFGEMMMPSSARNDDEISDIIIFLAGKKSPVSAKATQAESAKTAQVVSPSQITLGAGLFQGKQRLTNGGVSCLSCHHVNSKWVAPGGSIARELTKSYSRIGSAGLRGMIMSSPFPTMKQAYRDHALTDHEIEALSAFLQHADEADIEHQNNPYPRRMLLVGIAGTLMLLMVYGLMFRKRKKGSVNQDIYDRQKIKSQ